MPSQQHLQLHSTSSLTDLQSIGKAQLEADISLLFDHVALPSPLNEAGRYAMQNVGKRVRPLLVLGSFFAISSQANHIQLDMVRRAMMAVELIHGYSLVHDDLPCMDDDELRRGQPTCHIRFGEATALLVGDVLQSLAFEVLNCPLPNFSTPQHSEQLLAVLASRARRMVAGQQLDLNGEAQVLNQRQLECIHQDKTGALIESAVMMGGLCATASDKQIEQLYQFARHIGLAFQVQDDVLDVIADVQMLGKPTGSDEKHQKSTYVRLLGIQNATNYANELFDLTRQSVAGFGEHNLLIQIANWLQQRHH